MPTARRLMIQQAETECKPVYNCTPAPVIKADWWKVAGKNCAGAYLAKGAASLADSYIDLSGSGNDLTLGVAPVWDAVKGWMFNGVNQWLNTGIILNIKVAASVIVRFDDVTRINTNSNLFGTPWFYINPDSSGVGKVYRKMIFRNGNLSNINRMPGMGCGIAAITTEKAYRNGAVEVSLKSDANYHNNSCYIGAAGGSSGARNFVKASIQTIAFYADILTDVEVKELTCSMSVL